MNDSDLDLINETLNGRQESFGRLVHRYQQRLVISLTRLTGSREEALDQAQEAFLLAYQKLSTFRGDANFYSWLFRIAYHCAMNHHRRRKPAVSLEHARETAGFDVIDPALTHPPERKMIESEELSLLASAMEDLSDEHRHIITLKDLEDLSYEQIAEILDCPIGTVRSRLHRARLDLKAILTRKQKHSLMELRETSSG